MMINIYYDKSVFLKINREKIQDIKYCFELEVLIPIDYQRNFLKNQINMKNKYQKQGIVSISKYYNNKRSTIYTRMKALEFYAQIVSNPQLLAQGNKIIAEYLRQSQQNRQQTLLNIFNPSIPVLTLVSTTYAFEIFQQLSLEQKSSTRAYLISALSSCINTQTNILTSSEQRKLDSLLIFINRIHSQDGYDKWIDLYKKVISGNPKNCANWVLKIFRNSDDRIFPLSKDILKQLINGSIIMNQEETIQVMYYCIKSLTHLSESDPQLFNEALKPYITNIILYSIQKSQSSAKIMIFCFKILTVLLSDLDLQANDELEGTLTVKKFIQNISPNICTEYLKQLTTRETICHSIDEQQEEDNNYSISIIMYQFLELLHTCIEQVQQNTLLVTALVATITDLASAIFWKKNQENYFIELQDEGLRTIRNKGIEVILSLFDTKPEISKSFYGLYIWSAIRNSMSSPKNNQIIINFFKRYQIDYINISEDILQQSACYILYSFTEQLLSDKNSKAECIKTLNIRIQNSSNTLAKITSILIMNKLLRSYPTSNNSQSLQYIAQLIKIAKNQIANIGIMLAICRGIGIAAFKNDLRIGQNIPKQIILTFIQYITSRAISPDCAYVVLETITKLAQINESNCNFLKDSITIEDLQIILKSYMHDGITGTIVVQLFGYIGNQQIFGQIWKALIIGQKITCSQQMLIDLIAIAIKNKKIRPSEMDVQSFLKKYSKNNEQMSKIQKIIKELFNNNPQLNFQKQTIQLLNKFPQKSWIVYMLKNNMLHNLEELFWKAINAACYEIISPFEFQCNLIIPYYLFIYNSEETLKSLAQKPGIYEQFFNQLYKFAELFTGDSLRIITSFVLLTFAKVDSSTQRKEKIVRLLQKYSLKPVDQWQDQEEEDYQDAIDKFFSKRMDNQVVQEAMRLGFPELAWETAKLQLEFNNLKKSLAH